MSENKCCGNCRHFKYEDSVGWGRCVGHMKEFGVHCSHTGCLEHKFVKNAINGWTEITPDNADEIDSDINYLVIATIEGGEVVCNMYNDWYLGLSSMAKYGGYYYYVLPELKIE
jgi:hypothetical protein